ncbi:MAG: BrnA antitoxin family protein [Pyramidobacter sp.]
MAEKSESYRREKQHEMSGVSMINIFLEVNEMREEYDIESLNPRKNPYAKRTKKQITINLDENTVAYFKNQSESVGIPYQTLINLYLMDCAAHERRVEVSWR